MVDKFRRLETYGDKFRAIFWGPSWEPGQARLGDEAEKLDVSQSSYPIPIFTVLLFNTHYSKFTSFLLTEYVSLVVNKLYYYYILYTFYNTSWS